MFRLSKYLSGIEHLFYPHLCLGCGDDQVNADNYLCITCTHKLPRTDFAAIRDNATEKIFYGRVDIKAGCSLFYFAKDAIVQNLIHHLKYKKQARLGNMLGRMMGKELIQHADFAHIEMLVPLPLFKEREKQRGYNQSQLLCDGISQESGWPVIAGNLIREHKSESQTKKHRRERWKNVKDIFKVTDPTSFKGKHILLVDDVVTTGATLESAATVLHAACVASVSVATLAIATK